MHVVVPSVSLAALLQGAARTVCVEMPSGATLASGEDRGWAARVRSSRLTVSGVELAPIPGQELI
jgi:hypothetical protein